VLNKEAIELSPAQTSDDFLRQIPGFNLVQQGSSRVVHPAVQSLSMRGVGGYGNSRTLVLLDGLPLNGPFAGWILWGQVPPGVVEQVEVVRGGGASVWGNGALGGVVHLITKKPTERTIGIRAEAGNKETYQLTFLGGEQIGRWTVDGSVDLFDTAGYPRVEPEARGPIDIAQSSEHLGAALRVRHQVTDSVSWYLQGRLYDEDRVHGTPLGENSTDNDRLRAGVDWMTTGGSLWAADLYSESQRFSQFTTSISLDRTEERPSQHQFDVPGNAAGLGLQWSKVLSDRHFLSAGFDARLLDGETSENSVFIDDAFTRGRSAGGEQQFTGLFFRDMIQLGSRWQLDLGARIDFWRLDNGSATELDLETGGIIGEEFYDDRSEDNIDPTVGFVYSASSRLSVRGSAYSAFRAPTISELYRPVVSSNNRITAANSDLDPETLAGVESGVDYSLTSSTFGRVTVFWNEVDDAIAEVTIDEAGDEGGFIEPCGVVGPRGVCRQRRNVGTIRNLGVELELTSSPIDYWTFGGSYLYDDNEIVDASELPDLVGKRARQVALHQFTVMASYTNSKYVDGYVQGRYVGDRYDDDRNTRPVDEFFVVDFFLGRQIIPSLSLALSVENVFDERLEISGGRTNKNLGNPRLYRLGLRYRFHGN